MPRVTHSDITSGRYAIRVDRAKHPVDGEYDYCLAIDVDGKSRVLCEVFGRIGSEITVEAEKIANYIASLINNSGASKNANG